MKKKVAAKKVVKKAVKKAVKQVKVSKKAAVVKKTKPAKAAAKAPIAASADQDIVGLLTMLVQKLTSFESKLDMVLGRLANTSAPAAPKAQASAAVVIPPVVQNKPPKPPRQMYEAVCADCGQDCSVPFKPREDSPVYCKGCFTKRKTKVPFNPAVVKPKEEPNPEVKSPKAKPANLVSKAKAKSKKK